VNADDEDTVLCFTGEVESGAEPEDPEGGPTIRIGGVDVVAAIEAAWKETARVTVALADERFTGMLDVDSGARGYSEWTPAETATLRAGEHDVLARLRVLDGRRVTVWVSGRPVDVSDPVVAEPMVEVRLAHHWRGHLPGATLTVGRDLAGRMDADGLLARP